MQKLNIYKNLRNARKKKKYIYKIFYLKYSKCYDVKKINLHLSSIIHDNKHEGHSSMCDFENLSHKIIKGIYNLVTNEKRAI